jgi:3-methylcrotonyl-CoA carboxylase alpha subunit
MRKKVQHFSGIAVRLPTGLPSDYQADQRILSPIPGIVKQVFVRTGDRVAAGDPLLVIEAMKMKNTLRSGHNLVVAAVHIGTGELVKAGQVLIEFQRPIR